MKYLRVAAVSLLLTSCGGQTNNDSKNTADTIQQDSSNINAGGSLKYDDSREDLKYELNDTLKISKSFYFSENKAKDIFQLTIYPGLINNSKSDFKIITSEGVVIYEQVFDSFYFTRGVFVPDSVPTAEQGSYDQYLKKYKMSLTQKQYDRHIKKRIDHFFDGTFVTKEVLEQLNGWDDVDKTVLKEILSDTTIVVADIACYDCDEGGSMIYFSRTKKKIETLVSHD
jgi:hypothetical protein